MSDQNAQELQATFNIQRIYLKDMSLEQPNSPAIFLEQDGPNIEIQIDVGNQKLADDIYEATVTVTITAKIRDKIAFLVEGKQGGIFEVRNVPEEQIEPLLGIACPNIIYPYLRANIADMVTRGGFPPIHLTEINFEVFYQQRKQALAQAPTTPVQSFHARPASLFAVADRCDHGARERRMGGQRVQGDWAGPGDHV